MQEDGEEKNTMNFYQRSEGEDTGIINSNRAMTVNREESVCELPFISTALPESPHTASPLHQPGILWNMYKANRGGVDARTFLLHD